MNELIISPWAVYLITRLDAIRDFMLAVIFIGVFIPIISPLLGAMFEIDDLERLAKRYLKAIVMAIIVAGFCLALLPSTKEAIMIYAASRITPQTIQTAGDSVDKAVDKVVEKILKVKEDK
mgnify:CR=1 FL=1